MEAKDVRTLIYFSHPTVFENKLMGAHSCNVPQIDRLMRRRNGARAPMELGLVHRTNAGLKDVLNGLTKTIRSQLVADFM